MRCSSVIAALLLFGAAQGSAAAELVASTSADSRERNERAPGSAAEPLVTTRYTLSHSDIESLTRSASGRYVVRARLAPAERTGELREGVNFTLIGRFAKAGSTCSPTIFQNGFE